jgi:hypothetical protein
VKDMLGTRTLVIGGLAIALVVPAGVAVAAAATPSPTPSTSGPSYGPGGAGGPGGWHGRMMGGAGMGAYGDPDDCPFYDSAQAQQWRADREQRQQLPLAERQKLAQEHRAQMQQLRTGAAGS